MISSPRNGFSPTTGQEHMISSWPSGVAEPWRGFSSRAGEAEAAIASSVSSQRSARANVERLFSRRRDQRWWQAESAHYITVIDPCGIDRANVAVLVIERRADAVAMPYTTGAVGNIVEHEAASTGAQRVCLIGADFRSLSKELAQRIRLGPTISRRHHPPVRRLKGTWP